MSALLTSGTEAFSSESQATRLMCIGRRIVVGAVIPLVLWMCLAPLSMAVVAPAFVKVDLNRRPVQHLEGGIVREVLVRDGQRVKAGDPVLILGDVRVDADRNRLSYLFHVERAAIVRLEAEQARAKTLTFPADLLALGDQDERIRQAIAKEQAVFEAQRHSLESEEALMREQRERVKQELVGVHAQIEQAQSSYDLQHQDLETHRRLNQEGFISANRLSQLEATVMEYAAKLEERRTELARADQRLVEIQLKIQSVRNAYVKAASDQLKTSAQRLREIEQEQRKSDDAAQRQIVAAPASGEIIDLRVTSAGAVVGAGETIADIVPSDTQLMIEAHIRPEDVSNVYIEQRARVKFTTFKYRNSSMVEGKVTYVSGDRLVDRQTNLPYYSVMILADPQSLRAIREFRLQAGMPAEVYIEGNKLTAFQYLAAPVMATLRRAGRQM